jgi:hypothetical protein
VERLLSAKSLKDLPGVGSERNINFPRVCGEALTLMDSDRCGWCAVYNQCILFSRIGGQVELNEKQSLVWSVLCLEWKTGLQVQKEIKEKHDRNMSIADLYPILHWLETHGMVETKIEEAATGKELVDRGGARRRYYRRKAGGLRAGVETRSSKANIGIGSLSPA